MIGRPVAAWLLALAAIGLAATARANDFDQFQNARVAYESLNYELAADVFEGLLADAAPDDKRPLSSESRKYLAAAYLFLGRNADAEAQFTILLRAEPGYVLDPLAFPEEVGKVFAAAKAKLAREQAQAAHAHSLAVERDAGSRQATDRAQRDRMQRLIKLARTERVEQVRSRWVAAVPFGVGQFQNDNNGLGIVLAVSEGTLLATSIAAYAIHESLRGQDPKLAVRDDARRAEQASRYTNQISLAVFGVVALLGILDAEQRFTPVRSIERPRPLPPGFSDVGLAVGPAELVLSGRF